MSFSEWKTYKLEDILTIPLKNGVSKPSRVRGSGYKMVNMGELFANSIIGDIEMERVPMTERELSNYLLEYEDLLFARQSLTIEGAGKCSIFVGQSKHTTYEGHLMRLRIGENYALPRYVFYYFNSPVGKNKIKTIVTSTAAAGIRGSDLKNIELTIPDLKTQRRITSILSSIDDKIELNHQTNKTLETIGQTLFKEMCLPKGEELPDGWEVGVLFDVCKLIGGGTPKTDKIEYWENGNIDWISAKDITPNNGSFIIGTEKKITELGLKNSSAKLLPELATIISARGTVGNVCIISKPMTISQSNYSLVAIYPNTEYYLFCIVLSLVNQLKQRAYGTIFDTITTNSLSDLEIIIPRKEILLNFNKIITPIFEQIRSNIEEIQTLTTLRDSLLPKLMKGEIAV